MRVSSAIMRRRISRSLVTVLTLTLIQTVALPIVNPQIADAYTQGTVTNGTAYGGGGGSLNGANQNCTNGAIVAIGTSKSGDNLNSFMFICKALNNDATLSATEVTTNVFNNPSESDRCAAGQIGIGVRVIASNGGNLVGGVGLICGNPMSQGNPNTRSIMPNATSAGTVFTFTCPTGQLLAGFALRTGSLVDQITPKCSTFTAFVYAGIGAPTVTNLSTTSASVAFTALTSNFADTALQYTVTATPISGSAITSTGSTSPIVISNLRPNSSYKYSVTASNTYGATASATGTTVLSTTGLPTETDTALTFNGTSQYAWVADTGTGGVFDITGAITLEAWVNPTESLANTQYTVICKSEAYQLFHFGGIWKYSLQGSTTWGSGVSTGIKVALNEWHHIAITRAANTNVVNFYYDGQLVFSGGANTAASSTIASNNLAFGIGGMVYNNPSPTIQYGFKGQIDHVAIFDVVRSLADIDSDMDSYISSSTSGLRAYYDFNETSGSTLYNRTSTATVNSDLALVAAPTFNDVKTVSSTSTHTTIRFPRTYINANGGWVVPSGVSQVTAFIVGGGGGGGWNSGGGGGGAGFLTQSNTRVSGTVGVQIQRTRCSWCWCCVALEDAADEATDGSRRRT